MKQNPLEKEIQLSICDYLALKKHFFWRQNTSPIFDTKSNFYRPMPKYSKTGVPDILVVFKGQLFGIEVKREKTYQSDNQKEFEKDFIKAGGVYLVARSIDDVIKYGL
jgi:hypothetical protein